MNQYNKSLILEFYRDNVPFWSYYPIFTTLKKFITILIALFGITFTSFAQAKTEQDPAAKIVKFYPNPATTAINFELPKGYDKSYTIQLFNFMGKKVAELNASSLRLNYSLDGLYRGIYIFQLRDKYGKVVDSGKFQVVR